MAASHDGNDEPVRHGAQFFRQVKGEGRPAGARAMQEPDLAVETDTLGSPDAFRCKHGMAKPEHGVDGIARRTSRPDRRRELTRLNRSSERAKVDPGGIAFHAPNLIARAGVAEPDDTLPCPGCTSDHPLGLRGVLPVSCPSFQNRLLWSFAATIVFEISRAWLQSDAALFCASLGCTFPLAGPLTMNLTAPLLRSAATRTPRRTHASSA